MGCFDHASGEYLKINDAEIYCEVRGKENNPALLFLHGGLGNVEDFNHVISQLHDQFRIIGIDSRGHGKSTLGSFELSYELLQKDVEIILKQLGVNNLSIVGFSNGGIVAYRLAALTNLKINKLITIGAPWCTQHTKHLKQAYSKLTSAVWKEQCPADFESYQRLNPNPEFDVLFRQSIKMALDESSSGRPDELVKNITCSTLILRGENDPIVSNSDIIELTKLVKQSKFYNIPGAGHEAFKDQPEIFMEHLNEFLSVST